MGDGMPYWLEKGPALSVLEDFLSDADRLQTYLSNLLQGKRIVECGGYDDRSFPAAAKYTKGNVKRHVNEDWFKKNGTFWFGYQGEKVEEIVRQAMIRAACVSLGIKDPQLEKRAKLSPEQAAAVVAGPHRRLWPISMFWKCGQSWFETWVTWSGKPSSRTAGSVTVLFATPADNYQPTHPSGYGGVEQSPVPDAHEAAQPTPRGKWLAKGRDVHKGFAAEVTGRKGGPVEAVDGQPAPPLPALHGAKGMLVVTHESNGFVPVLTSDSFRSRIGVDPPPRAHFQGRGEIVVVSPSETWGGILAPAGRPYQGPST